MRLKRIDWLCLLWRPISIGTLNFAANSFRISSGALFIHFSMLALAVWSLYGSLFGFSGVWERLDISGPRLDTGVQHTGVFALSLPY
jgi:hypothetical protein